MTTPTDTTRATDSPAAQWRKILRAPRSDAEQARIETAMHLAHAALETAANDKDPMVQAASLTRDVLSSSSSFSRVALMWHRVLTETDAFARSRASDATTCRFDPDAARTWLTSPHQSGAGAVADELHIGPDFDIYGFDKWVRIGDLLAKAQESGVFGVPDHTVGVLHLAGERGFVDRHRVTLHTPQHAVLCSDDLDTADLMTEHLAGVNAAVHVLGQVARAADQLLYQRAVLADVAWPTPTHHHTAATPAAQPLPSKAFRPLATVNPNAAGPTQPTPAAPGVAVTRSHR